MTAKGHECTFWGDRKSLYFNCSGGWIGVYIHQNSSNCILKRVHYNVCKLNLTSLFKIL